MHEMTREIATEVRHNSKRLHRFTLHAAN